MNVERRCPEVSSTIFSSCTVRRGPEVGNTGQSRLVLHVGNWKSAVLSARILYCSAEHPHLVLHIGTLKSTVESAVLSTSVLYCT